MTSAKAVGGSLRAVSSVGEDRIGEQQSPPAPKKIISGLRPIRSLSRPGERLDQQHEQRQRHGHDPRRRRPVEPARVGEIFLHVDGVGVEGERAAGGQRHHQQRLARMIAEQVARRRLRRRSPLAATFVEAERLVEPAADEEDDDRQHRADRRRRCASPRPPAPPRRASPAAPAAAPARSSCPPIIVTYWKLDQKPRRSRSGHLATDRSRSSHIRRRG